MAERQDRDERLRRYWNKHAGSNDKQMGFLDRYFFGDSRDWICSKASGQVLEAAIGTGLNLPHYRGGIELTRVKWSPAMLDIARHRAERLGRDVDLRPGDALQFPDASFDTVVCTFSLCAISDHEKGLREMGRVPRPGGLLLADHVVAASGSLVLRRRAVGPRRSVRGVRSIGRGGALCAIHRCPGKECGWR